MNKLQDNNIQGYLHLDGEKLLTWFETDLVISDAMTGHKIRKLGSHNDTIEGVELSPYYNIYDNDIISWDKYGILKVWDSINGKCKHTCDTRRFGRIQSAIKTPKSLVDRKRASNKHKFNKQSKLSDFIFGKNNESHKKTEHPYYCILLIKEASFNEYSTTCESTITIFDPIDGEDLVSICHDLRSGCYLEFSLDTSDGWLIFLIKYYTDYKRCSNNVLYWRPISNSSKFGKYEFTTDVLKEVRSHDSDVLGCVELENGWIATWSKDLKIKIWTQVNYQENWECVHTLIGHKQLIERVVYRGNNLLMSLAKDGTKLWWDILSGKNVTAP